jgi:hypothetical protein
MIISFCDFSQTMAEGPPLPPPKTQEEFDARFTRNVYLPDIRLEVRAAEQAYFEVTDKEDATFEELADKTQEEFDARFTRKVYLPDIRWEVRAAEHAYFEVTDKEDATFEELADALDALALGRAKICGDLGIYYTANGRPLPYQDAAEELGKRLAALTPAWYLNPLLLPDIDEVGEVDFPCESIRDLKFGYHIYLDWKAIWFGRPDKHPPEESPRLAPTASWEEFYKQFRKEACTEWHKMDEEGESYGGAWQAEEGSEERKNAWELCGERNARALYSLGYPPAFIMHTIHVGCSSRRESVPYCAMLCEWMKQKIALDPEQ